MIPWFSKTKGNTYATLLHHPFLFKEIQHSAQEVADTQPESQEHKVLWDKLELALQEDAAPVPAPVPAPAAPIAPAPIPVALMG